MVASMSKRTRNLHAWKSRDDDGVRREVRAQLAGGTWTLSSRVDGEDDWVVHDPPLLADLEDLQEVVFNKYQRKHAAWTHVLSIRKLIEARS